MAETPLFDPVNALNFHAQPRGHLFRRSSDEISRIARWRSNLSALSQRRNLYFTAYKDVLHITIPRDLRQTIPVIPDLKIALPTTRDGIKIGGYIEPDSPHSVNYMRIGDLGNLEIILLACDDGDVLAYYTHLLWHELTNSSMDERPITSVVQPCFHENVGHSAWGLAIHTKSRLIAVSHNGREVEIFCLAQNSSPESCAEGSSNDDDEARNICTNNSKNERHAPSLLPSQGSDELNVTSNTRDQQKVFVLLDRVPDVMIQDYNYRVTLVPEGDRHNIPSIDFASDALGNAHCLLAAAINMRLWSFNLRTAVCRQHFCDEIEVGLGGSFLQGDLGWGVIVLPLHYFMFTETPHEGLGTESLDVSLSRHSSRLETTPFPKIEESHFESSWSGLSLPDQADGGNPISPAHSSSDLLQDSSSDTDSPQMESELEPKIHAPLLDTGARKSSDILRLKTLLNLPARIRRQYGHISTWNNTLEEQQVQHQSTTWKHLPPMHNDRSMQHPNEEPKPANLFPDRSAMMFISNSSIHLISPQPDYMLQTLCANVFEQYRDPRLPISPLWRLNMHALIPELSLVIVASQEGLAALISLTRLAEDFSNNGPVVMCRVDQMLPLPHHQEHRKNPKVRLRGRGYPPLLGISVAPLQGRRNEASRNIWRLFLHQYDDTILCYELSRNDKHKLMVF